MQALQQQQQQQQQQLGMQVGLKYTSVMHQPCMLCLTHVAVLLFPEQPCAAGDSAAYERRSANLDDVVIVAALRTPLTKVGRRTRLHGHL